MPPCTHSNFRESKVFNNLRERVLASSPLSSALLSERISPSVGFEETNLGCAEDTGRAHSDDERGKA